MEEHDECTLNVAQLDQLLATYNAVMGRDTEEDDKQLEGLGIDKHTFAHLGKEILAEWAEEMNESDEDGTTRVEGTSIIVLICMSIQLGMQLVQERQALSE